LPPYALTSYWINPKMVNVVNFTSILSIKISKRSFKLITQKYWNALSFNTISKMNSPSMQFSLRVE
jgi:hypothetical protein